MNIVLAGGTGFIGQALLEKLLEAKHSVILLTRNPGRARSLAGEFVKVEKWDGKTVGLWAQHIDDSDAVINLAGESIGEKRWTKARKALILNSRVDATKALVAAIAQSKKKPSVLVNQSAVGYYGNVETGDVGELHPKGNDFLADVADRWEQEARVAEALGVRVVTPRCGVVLEKDGGALKKMLIPFKLFVGGPLGSGHQWFPWVHRDDVVGAFLFALDTPKLSGPVNVAAPEAVTMKEFCSALGKTMRRPAWAPVPAFVLRAALGEMSFIVLTGQRVVPKKLLEAGYPFRYRTLDVALQAIFKN